MDPQTRIVTAQVIYQTNDWTRVMDFNDSLYELISLLLKQISAHLAAGDRRSFDLVFGKVYDRLLAFLTSEEARMKLGMIHFSHWVQKAPPLIIPFSYSAN